MSGLFQDVITIINRYTTNASGWSGGTPPVNTIAYSRTVIKNVMWKDKLFTTANEDKPFINKTVSITIPLDEMRADKKYAKPKDFTPDNWTLQIGDLIVFGEFDKEITNTYTTDNLRKEYKVMEIQAVSDSTDQDILPCWKIEGV